jgi:hypothetical protein
LVGKCTWARVSPAGMLREIGIEATRIAAAVAQGADAG